MTGNDHRDRVGAVSRADGPYRRRVADALRELAIRDGGPAGDPPQGLPDGLLERRPVQLDRNRVEDGGFPLEVAFEERSQPVDRLPGSRLSGIPALEHRVDARAV